MTEPRIVYVHGAGKQENRVILKRRLDEHLFGSNQLDRTVLAYYSDLLHDDDPVPFGLEAAPAAESAEAAAAVDPAAVAIREAFEARADVVAAKLAGGAATTPDGFVPEQVMLPDPAFRLFAEIASRDVIDYLIGDRGPAIRQRVAEAIPGTGPLIVLAHSLGTIVAYDVLFAMSDRDVRLFLTVGCPLGIGNVQERIGDRAMPPKVPRVVGAWSNFADRLDPVALEPHLGGDYDPNGFIVDTFVNNRALLNHDLTGYLDTRAVREAIQIAMA